MKNKTELMSTFYAAVPLLIINFVLTLSKFTAELLACIRGSKAALTML